MGAVLLDGKRLAEKIQSDLRTRIAARGAPPPHLCVIQTVPAPASQVYARQLARACQEIGMTFSVRPLGEDLTGAALAEAIRETCEETTVCGVILQMPIPPSIDPHEIRIHIERRKDVERINPTNLGFVVYANPSLAPCTAMAVMELIALTGRDLRGAEAVVVGHSEIVGKPIALLLLDRLATVTVCHVGTRDLAAHTRRADILVVAVGRPALVTRDMIKPGAVVLDVGVNRVGPEGETRLVGDVAGDVCDVAGHLTPVPGGVGPVTVAMMLRNTVLAWEAAAGRTG
ncbi:MAG: bifunctional 5,10-methylenetetrahydrofolate dehydrogenase/5,10-methenyltetrahydrofolate cyclohydrolase [Planctomycetes bacterium]|nr:bifunctional 5,10-methylenetetrahydrofolate dehydrogenase/5,10-methenyltetrahydrofolate cyclohydrolase [Planctomycetota bacterium]